MKKKHPLFTGLLAVVYFISNVVVLHSAETNFWNERRVQAKRYSASPLLCQLPPVRAVGFIPSQGEPVSGGSPGPTLFTRDISQSDLISAKKASSRDDLPNWLGALVSPFGNVRDIHVSSHSDRPLIIHIQDIHGNVDAQKNIAHMIGALSSARGVTLVGLEGASGPFDLDDLRRFPDPDVKEDATNWAIKKDLIGGAEKIGITSEKPLTLWGIEDKVLYEANVAAVKGSLAGKTEVLSFLREFNSVLDRLKNAIYSVDLAVYDDTIRSYQEGRLGLADYLVKLVELDSNKSSFHARSPNIAVLLEAFKLESNLDFKEVERQRTDMVEELARRLNETELKELVDQSLSFRAGRTTYSRYYAHVKGLCKKARVDLDRFSALMDYMAYVGLTDQINRDRLLTELSVLEETVGTGLARTDQEKGVLALSRDIHLLGNLTNNTMTPETWARYQTRREFVRKIVSRTSALANGAGVEFTFVPPNRYEDLLNPFEDFCRFALERDTALTDRLWKKMGETKSISAILVAGGFHTEGMTEEIKRRGGSYIVLTPRVETIDTKGNYLDAFAHDPLPLEKLFDGEKIGILTLRGLSQDAQWSGDSGTVPQKLGVAMVLNAIQRVFSKMNLDKETVNKIKARLEEKISEFQLLGELFRRSSLKVKAMTPSGVAFEFSINGQNFYSGRIGESGNCSLTPLNRPKYNRFLQSKVGEYLNANATFLFKAISAIYAAPKDEAHLTTNKTLDKFFATHSWKGIDVLVGFQLVRLMVLMTFAPALSLFYFAMTGDVHGVFRIVLAVVGLIAFFRNNDFYVFAHRIINLILVIANSILVVLDSFAKIFNGGISFRFKYLMSRYSLNISPSWYEENFPLTFYPTRRIDKESIIEFKDFLKKLKEGKLSIPDKPNNEIVGYRGCPHSPGFWQFIYIWKKECEKTPELINNLESKIEIGIKMANEIRLVEFDLQRYTWYGSPPLEWTGIRVDQEETWPGFFPNLSGLSVALKANIPNMGFHDVETAAAFYDAYIDYCFLAAADRGVSVDDLNHKEMYLDFLRAKRWRTTRSYLPIFRGNFDELKPDRSKGWFDLKDRSTYSAPFIILIDSETDTPIPIWVYHREDLPLQLKARVNSSFEAFKYHLFLVWEMPNGIRIQGIRDSADGQIPTVFGSSYQGIVDHIDTHTKITLYVENNKGVFRFNINSVNDHDQTKVLFPKKITHSESLVFSSKIALLKELTGLTNEEWDLIPPKQKFKLANWYWEIRCLTAGVFRSQAQVQNVTGNPTAFKDLHSLVENSTLENWMKEFDSNALLPGLKVSEKLLIKGQEISEQDSELVVNGYHTIRAWKWQALSQPLSVSELQRYIEFRLGFLYFTYYWDRSKMSNLFDREQPPWIIARNPAGIQKSIAPLLGKEDFTPTGSEEDHSPRAMNDPHFMVSKVINFPSSSQRRVDLESRISYLESSGESDSRLGIILAKVGLLNLMETSRTAEMESDNHTISLPPEQKKPGSWGLWDWLGMKNLSWNGFYESVFVGAGAVSGLNKFVSNGFMSVPADWVSLFSPETFLLAIAVYLVVFLFHFLMHFFTGVQQWAGKRSITFWKDGPWVTAREAWGATKTAARGQMVGAIAIVAGVLLQSPGVAVIGILWWATRHAYKNYTIGLPYRHARKIATGVEMVAYPTNSEGQLANQDPRASMTDFLKTIFLGSPAAPRLMPVERTVFAFQVKNMDAALAAKTLFGTTNDSLLQTDPARWVAQEGLSFLDRSKTEGDMARHIAFLNLVVQTYHRMGGPSTPTVFEMPSPFQLREDPAVSMVVAAALISYGAGNRPMTFVAKRGETGDSWLSQESMQEAALAALARYAPHRVGDITRKFKDGQISTILATENLVNSQGQFLLARILTHAFGMNALRQQPYVFGKQSSFDFQGTENPIFFDIILFARELIKNVQKHSLFLIAA